MLSLQPGHSGALFCCSFFGCAGAALQFLGRVHGLAAAGSAAVAGGLVLVSIVEVVVVGQLLSGRDIANGNDPDASSYLVGFAIGIAGMIDEHGHAVSVDHS